MNTPRAFSSDCSLGERIWRYLDFTKFVSLLDTKAIYFPRADLLGDPFEGSFPEKEVASMGLLKNVLAAQPSKKALRTGKQIRNAVREFRSIIYVSCWHINEHESAAMWKLYLKSDEGVAIQSTLPRLKKGLAATRKVKIARVNYIDYQKDPIGDVSEIGPMLAPFLHKRKSFEHEREARALFCDASKLETSWDPDKGTWIGRPFFEKGHYVKVDLATLIDQVFVAPNSAPWFLELVRSVISRYQLNKNVIQSHLSDAPLW